MHHKALPTLFVPHGGGPLPILKYPCHASVNQFLEGLAQQLPEKPQAIVVVSAHWEEEHPTLTSSARPELLYDYYGFPPDSYQLQYPAPGSPQLAARAAELLRAAGFPACLDPQRGLDHGTFIPLKMIFPAADIPVVQLSLKSSLDPEEHYAMGAALGPLRQEGVLLLGSGMSFHDMGTFRMSQAVQPDRDPATLPGQDFNTWLRHTCLSNLKQRKEQLVDWAAAPGARSAHPREEHLMPLLVVAGAAHENKSSSSSRAVGHMCAVQEESDSSNAEGHVLWDGECMGVAVSGYAFGQLA